jgi:hypothetical protein
VEPLGTGHGLAVKRHRPQCSELRLDGQLIAGLLVSGLSCPVGQLGDQWRPCGALRGGRLPVGGKRPCGHHGGPRRCGRKGSGGLSHCGTGRRYPAGLGGGKRIPHPIDHQRRRRRAGGQRSSLGIRTQPATRGCDKVTADGRPKVRRDMMRKHRQRRHHEHATHQEQRTELHGDSAKGRLG